MEREKELLIKEHEVEDDQIREELEKKFELEKTNLQLEWYIYQFIYFFRIYIFLQINRVPTFIL